MKRCFVFFCLFFFYLPQIHLEFVLVYAIQCRFFSKIVPLFIHFLLRIVHSNLALKILQYSCGLLEITEVSKNKLQRVTNLVKEEIVRSEETPEAAQD